MRALFVIGVGVGAACLGLGCSLIDGHFDQCKVDADCKGGQVCAVDPQNTSQHFCLPNTVPVGCSGLLDAGILATYGNVDGGTLHLGAAINFTSGAGVLATNKVENLNAIRMALDEINVNGGAGNNQTFVLHVCDTAGDPTRLALQLPWLIGQMGAQAIIIPGSTQVINAAAVTVPEGILIMSPTATSPSITQLPKTLNGSAPLIWRTCPSDNLQGEVIADLLMGPTPFDAGVAVYGALKVAVVYSSEPYGQGLESVIQATFDAGTTRTLNTFPYTRDGDISGAISGLAAFGPQVTVLIGFPEDVPRIVNAAVLDAGLTAATGHRWIFTDSAKDPSIISGVTDPSQIATALGTAPAQGAGVAYPNFAGSFKTRFGVDPANYGFTSQSYDAMYLLALAGSYAVGSAGTQPMTGVKMAEGLTHVASATGTQYQLGPSAYIGARSDLQVPKDIKVLGTSGSLNFNTTTGESPAPIEIWGISDGGFSTLTTIELPSN